ncbi:MAG: hypothetical protein U0S50_04100 [Sphingopyxis sp.]|uniref:hypothetical protein n=1 Tax=Sphingopyxis sp. TaxID=1908224 RepID=UPI002ABBBC14|nr:hypothetical protein [Sphingopyxis sp.]MDZ3830983.1 hypothetical protein [Sphingopyxis sp.]
MSALLLRAAAALLAVVPAATAQAHQSEAERDQIRQQLAVEDLRDCKLATMERCWYGVFGTGEAPNRRLWFADMKARPTGAARDAPVEIDVMVAYESKTAEDSQGNEFVFYTLQYDCAGYRLRMADGYAFMRNGKIDRATEAGPWISGYRPSWYSLVEKLACDAKVRLSPQTHQMFWAGDFFRPVDLFDFTYRYLWEHP